MAQAHRLRPRSGELVRLDGLDGDRTRMHNQGKASPRLRGTGMLYGF